MNAGDRDSRQMMIGLVSQSGASWPRPASLAASQFSVVTLLSRSRQVFDGPFEPCDQARVLIL